MRKRGRRGLLLPEVECKASRVTKKKKLVVKN